MKDQPTNLHTTVSALSNPKSAQEAMYTSEVALLGGLRMQLSNNNPEDVRAEWYELLDKAQCLARFPDLDAMKRNAQSIVLVVRRSQLLEEPSGFFRLGHKRRP